jgi:omega-6 fatty acid desaturase (delta-12 desaturase)
MRETKVALTDEDIKKLSRSLESYRQVTTARSTVELTLTAVPFVALWALMWVSLDVGYWLCLLLALPTAGFLIRLFILQHDCGHGSFFRRRSVNDWVGRVVGVVTLTPYDCWRRTHATHHGAVGGLEHRGVGDIKTLTVREYLALGSLSRLRYRLYRHPAIMFGLIPAYLFLLHYRLPVGLMRKGWKPWLSSMATNAAIATAVGLMAWLVGARSFLLVEGPVVLIAASVAVWLFYVQHQFEHTRWDDDTNWNVHTAALHGSSYYALPPVLAWLTGNIGVHHVHHMCSRIPSYRLSEVLRDHPELAAVGRLTVVQSLRCAVLALWDERERRLISFRELRARASH